MIAVPLVTDGQAATLLANNPQVGKAGTACLAAMVP